VVELLRRLSIKDVLGDWQKQLQRNSKARRCDPGKENSCLF
jgi:hypothetical protein